jgi:hypothetical protein
VNDYVAVIEEHPAAAAVLDAFDAQRADVLFHTQVFEQIIFNRFGLALIVDGCNDEIIGNGRLFVNVEQDDIGCLLFLDDLYDMTGKCVAVQIFLLVERVLVERVPKPALIVFCT